MRPVIFSDFDAVYNLYMNENVNPFLHYEVMNKDQFLPIFEDLMRRNSFWAYESLDNLIGMCTCQYGVARNSHVATLGCLAIAPEYQNRGHAKKFLENVIDNLLNKGFRRIDLSTTADNEKALRFYKKMGFRIDGRIPKYCKRANSNEYIDDIILSKWF